MYETTLTDAEAMLKVAKAMSELKDLLEPENIEKSIKGLEGAKEIFKQKDIIQAKLDKAEKMAISNEVRAQELDAQQVKIKEENVKLDVKIELANSRITKAEEMEKANEVAAQKNSEHQANLESREAIVLQREAATKKEYSEAAEANKKAQERLEALTKVVGV